MRPVWNGAISFGLVNIPVDLISAEKTNDIKFNLVDSRDNNRIKYERVNEETGEEVPWNKIVKAYEFSDDNYVIVTDEDFEKADVKASKTIDIESFINKEELDYMFMEKPYYIRPRKGGEKAYTLLKRSLLETSKVAISKVVIRTREYLAAIYSNDHYLILNLLRFKQELKDIEELGEIKEVEIKDKELELAKTLIEDMTEKWDPSKFKDEYRDKLMDRINQKAKGMGLDEEVEEDTEEEVNNVVDIMDLLRKSVYPDKASKESKDIDTKEERDEKESMEDSKKAPIKDINEKRTTGTNKKESDKKESSKSKANNKKATRSKKGPV